MTDEQIKQNAEAYVEQNKVNFSEDKNFEVYDYDEQKEAYVAGAHSRDEEIEKLKDRLRFADESIADADKWIAKYKLYIANIEAKLDKLRNPWISVEDRLPDKYVDFCGRILDFSDKVLVKTKEHPDYWLVAEYYHNDNEWICLENNTYVIRDKVTHWMPIHV